MADFDAQAREWRAQVQEVQTAMADARFARRSSEIVNKHGANAYGG